MSSWNPVRHSAMHHKHLALGASMVDRDGWQQPTRYSSEQEELQSLKDGGGLHDISPCGKLIIQGEDVESFLASTFPDIASLTSGEVRMVATTKMSELESLVLARLSQDEFLVLTPVGQSPALADAFGEAPDSCAHVLDMTSGLAGVRIIGPQAHLLLSAISELDVSDTAFPNMRCARTKAAEIHGTVLRMDRGELPCYELYFTREFGEYMWDALLEAGAEYGVAPVGLEAMAGFER